MTAEPVLFFNQQNVKANWNRHQNLFPILLACSFLINTRANAQNVFTSVDSLLRYAAKKSISLQSGDIQWQQAKKAKLVSCLLYTSDAADE